MNLVIVALVLIIALMMVSSASATPKSAIPVIAIQTGGATFSDIVVNDGGIFSWHMIEIGIVKLYITSTLTPDYTLDSYGEAHAMINTNTDEGGFHRKMVWTYKVDGVVVGTFEGEVNVKTTTYLYNPTTGYPRAPYSTNIGHAVLQGSGIFEGQMLKLDVVRPTVNPDVLPIVTKGNPSTWTGLLL